MYVLGLTISKSGYPGYKCNRDGELATNEQSSNDECGLDWSLMSNLRKIWEEFLFTFTVVKIFLIIDDTMTRKFKNKPRQKVLKSFTAPVVPHYDIRSSLFGSTHDSGYIWYNNTAQIRNFKSDDLLLSTTFQKRFRKSTFYRICVRSVLFVFQRFQK